MRFLAETHSHTSISPHAYHSIQEMIVKAKDLGLELLSITNHGPHTPDGPHEWHFQNMKALPRKIGDLYLLHGVEANIIDMNGTIDVREEVLKRLDLVIASIHRPTLAPGTVEEHTNTYLKVIQNPYVDILGHCGSPDYSFDIDRVLIEVKKQDKIVEINNHTFSTRKASLENCLRIAKRCQEMGVKMVVSTDAHSIYELGKTHAAEQVIAAAGVDEELIMNTTAEKFLSYLCKRKGFDRARFEDEEPFGLPKLPLDIPDIF